MCLGVPGRVLSREQEDGLLMGRVDFGGVSRKVCLEHVQDVVPGDYVLVHVGFALSRIDADEARKIFELLSELDQLGELQEPSTSLDVNPERQR
ncbi:MAG TPA: HypC/HybG/HupF family hydrogenase formation chaperone [Polyangiaceae bacterium]|nr:HypC/HybG/HupF family hydrogenase formation chaperone [Polyangiaceae bacterium]